MTTADATRSAFALERVETLRFRAPSVPSPDRDVVFGGQLIGQALAAATAVEPAKRVRVVHTTFLRPGTVRQPVDIVVAPLSSGRTMSHVDVSLSQGDRRLAAARVTLEAPDADVIAHAATMPAVGSPPALGDGPQVHAVGDPDRALASSTSEPHSDVWVRWPSAGGSEPIVDQALVGWSTVPYLIGAALQPHLGFGIAMAHDVISTGVLAHTVAFHSAWDAARWHLVTNESSHAGAGRVYGTGHVFGDDGTHVAEFAQLALVRAAAGRVLGGSSL